MLKPFKTSKNKAFCFNNKGGFAAIEMIPILVVVVLLVNFSLGFFGAIHTGILGSIGARNYAFETFRHRSDLMYFRNIGSGNASEGRINYKQDGMRIHYSITENRPDATDTKPAAARTIDFLGVTGKGAQEQQGSDVTTHSKKVSGLKENLRNGQNEQDPVAVNPIWIKTAYGICLNADCGGQ